jgi:hypothetical protein
VAAGAIFISLEILVGEVWGVASAFLGCGAAVYLWFAGREAGVLLNKAAVFSPFLKAGPASFTVGMALVFQGVLYGSLAILVGYLLAELLWLLPVHPRGEDAVAD